MTYQAHLEVLAQGVDTWNEWRKKDLALQPDLSGANLGGADLTSAKLNGATLKDTVFLGAVLKDIKGLDKATLARIQNPAG